MARYITAAVVGCLYVAGSILVVQSQGRAYRKALITPELARKVEKPTLRVPKEADQKAPGDAISEVSSSSRVQAGEPPAPAETKAVPTPKPMGEQGSSAKPAVEFAKAAPSNPQVAKQASDHLLVAPNASANPLAQNSFWNQGFLIKDWDVASLKADDERRLGAEFYDLMVQLNLLAKEGPWLRRVEEAAEPLLATVHRKEIHYKFFILNSDGVNAFSTPGGYVYISRGLFDLIGEDEDYALQFVIGHEIAHVDLQHAIKCLQDSDVKKMPLGTLQKLFWVILPAGYLSSEKVDQEFQADEWIATRMQRFQSTRREMLIFLNKLDGYANTHGFADGHAKPQPDRDISLLDNHYRAQTAAWKRLKHLKVFMDQAATAPK
jgi:Peptidase family M48